MEKTSLATPLYIYLYRTLFWGIHMFSVKFRDDGCWFRLNVGAEQGDSSVAAQWTMAIWPTGHPVHRMHFVHYTQSWVSWKNKVSNSYLAEACLGFNDLGIFSHHWAVSSYQMPPVYQGKNIFPHYSCLVLLPYKYFSLSFLFSIFMVIFFFCPYLYCYLQSSVGTTTYQGEDISESCFLEGIQCCRLNFERFSLTMFGIWS